MTQQTTTQGEQPAFPVQSQPSGLEAFDLRIHATPLKITWDQAALSAAVDAVLDDYKGVTVTEDMVPAIKSEMAGLNKLKDRLDSARKDIVRQIKAPLDQFDQEVKSIINRVAGTRGTLDEQVKAWEKREREGRRRSVQFMIDAAVAESNIPGLVIAFDERWLNKGATTSKIAAEIANVILKTRQEREAADQLECAKQDRVTLVGEKVKAESERHGFDLPMGKFSPCLSLNMTADEAPLYIARAFEAEEAVQARQAATHVEHALVPTPASAPVEEAAFAMPTFSDPIPIPKKRVIALTIAYDGAVEADVLALIDRMRDLADVEIL